MTGFKRIVALVMIAAVSLALMSCERKITRVEASLQPLGCADCHNPSNIITGKEAEWEESVHGSGTAFAEEGPNANCAGCHSGHAFQERIAAGLDPNQLTEGDPDPTRQDCRACHMIHSTYTMQDFALRTTAPVNFYAIPNTTFDGGEGNLCVNCHQPRRNAPVANAQGIITGITTHWGPHHGPQSAMILGVGGAGVTGTPSGHYAVTNTCVHCHMGDERDHHFEPEVSRCQACHPGATNFDIDGVQTEIANLGDQLGALLLAANLINENSPDGHAIVTSAPEAQAKALWDWLYVMHEDRSFGVHNHDYAKALLDEGIALMTPPQPQNVP